MAGHRPSASLRTSTDEYGHTMWIIENSTRISALHRAIIEGSVDKVRTLTQPGDSEYPNYDELIYYPACLQGRAMLAALASTTIGGSTWLCWLLKAPQRKFVDGKKETIKFLLENGADPTVVDPLGNNTLHILVLSPTQDETDGIGILKLLMNDKSIPGAVQEQCLQMINVQTKYAGETPLLLAAKCNRIDCVRILLENGADPCVTGMAGRSPLDYAVRRGFRDIVDLLQSHHSHSSS